MPKIFQVLKKQYSKVAVPQGFIDCKVDCILRFIHFVIYHETKKMTKCLIFKNVRIEMIPRKSKYI